MSESLPELTTYRHDHCRVCDRELVPLWDLGDFAIVGFPTLDDPPLPRAPLKVMLCPSADGGCGLVQLRDTVPAERLFREYWYRSGTNEQMVAALHNVVDCAVARQPLAASDCVVDIGANDGTLLSYYETKTPPPRRIAFEPAANVQEELAGCCEQAFPVFFPPQPIPLLSAKIITACAMAYDLERPVEFFDAIRMALDPDGLFVLQIGYLGALFAQNAFDSICHEHLEYYSLTSLVHLLSRVGLAIVDAERNEVNGGSLRCYIRHRDHRQPVRSAVLRLLNEEAALQFVTPDPWKWLKLRVEKVRGKVLDVLHASANGEGWPDVYGASTKGLTLMQAWGLDSRLIHNAVDRSDFKVGRLYGSTGLGIIREETWRRTPGGLALVLPWHFRSGILEREKEYLARGGKFLFPLPKGEVV